MATLIASSSSMLSLSNLAVCSERMLDAEFGWVLCSDPALSEERADGPLESGGLVEAADETAVDGTAIDGPAGCGHAGGC